MLKVGIIGATGYTGQELIEILLRHPQVKLTYLAAKLKQPQDISQIFPRFSGQIGLPCGNLNMKRAKGSCDLLFFALPHRISMEYVPTFLEAQKIVIDLSADYRLKDASAYKRWYGIPHRDKRHVYEAVYGLPELYREEIKRAKLIANPGCYPTGVILGATPLIKERLVNTDWIIVDSKSGTTGAGRRTDLAFQFSEIDGNLKPYKVNAHQHMPEIEQELSKLAKSELKVTFVPHLISIKRGILSTMYFRLKRSISTKRLLDLYRGFYQREPFVKILNEGCYPEIRDVLGTNNCMISLQADRKESLCIVISAIDNLVKGASGQAVQNMNLVCGFEETAGLR